MQEYWVNVYSNHNLGALCTTREVAIEVAETVKTLKSIIDNKVIYRIHIKKKYVTGRDILRRISDYKTSFRI